MLRCWCVGVLLRSTPAKLLLVLHPSVDGETLCERVSADVQTHIHTIFHPYPANHLKSICEQFSDHEANCEDIILIYF